MITTCNDVNKLIMSYLGIIDIVKLRSVNWEWYDFITKFEPYEVISKIKYIFKSARRLGVICSINRYVGRIWLSPSRNSDKIIKKVRDEYDQYVVCMTYNLIIDCGISPVNLCMDISHMYSSDRNLNWFSKLLCAKKSSIHPFTINDDPSIYDWWLDYNKDMKLNYKKIGAYACERGHINVLNWCKNECEDVFHGHNFYNYVKHKPKILDWLVSNCPYMRVPPELFEKACSNGWLLNLKWLVNHMDTKMEEYLFINIMTLIYCASKHESTFTIRWLKRNIFAKYLTTSTIRIGYMSRPCLEWWDKEQNELWFWHANLKLEYLPMCAALYKLYDKSNYSALDWWVDHNKINALDMSRIIYRAVKENNHKFMEWVEHRHIPIKNCSFEILIPRLRTFDWLTNNVLSPSAKNLVIIERIAVRNAILFGRFDVLDWIAKHCGDPDSRDLVRFGSGLLMYSNDMKIINENYNEGSTRMSEWWRQAFIDYFRGKNNMKPYFKRVNILYNYYYLRWWFSIFKDAGVKDVIPLNVRRNLMKIICEHKNYNILHLWVDNIEYLSMPMMSCVMNSASKRGDIEMLDWWLAASKSEWFHKAGLKLAYSRHALESAHKKGLQEVIDWWHRNGLLLSKRILVKRSSLFVCKSGKDKSLEIQ